MDEHHDTRRLESKRTEPSACGDDLVRPCNGCLYRVKILLLYALVTVMALGGLYAVLAAGRASDPGCGSIAGCAARVDETCQVVSDGHAADVELAVGGCRGRCENGHPVEVVCVTAD